MYVIVNEILLFFLYIVLVILGYSFSLLKNIRGFYMSCSSVDFLLNGQDAQPRLVIPLWKSYLEEHKIQESDPSVVIVDNTPSNLILIAGKHYFNNSYCLLRFYLLTLALLSDLVSRGGRRRRRSCHTSWEARCRFRKSKST